MVDFATKGWENAPDGYREGDPLPPGATPLDADGLNDLEARVAASIDAVNSALGSASAPDATTTVKGSVQLAGDLAGTAAAPTVPALATKADLVAGKIPAGQIPTIATNETITVANQAARLTLTATQVQPGDLAIQTDTGQKFWLAAADASQTRSWVEVQHVDTVSSVNGQVGAIVIPVLTSIATKTAAYTANIGEAVPVSAAAGSVAITLPSGTLGAAIRVTRVDTGYSTDNIVTILGGPLSDEPLQPAQYIDFQHNGTAWVRYPGPHPAELTAPAGFQNADPLTDRTSRYQRPETRVGHKDSYEVLTFTSATDYDDSSGALSITASLDPYHPVGAPMMTTGNSGVVATMDKYLRAPVDISTKPIWRQRFLFDAASTTASFNGFRVRFATSRRALAEGNYAEFVVIPAAQPGNCFLGAWVERGGSTSQITQVGTGADLTNINVIQYAIQSTSSSAHVIVSMGPRMSFTPATSAKAKVVFSFDDNYGGDWSVAFGMMERYGWKGMLYACIAQVDGMTPEQLRRINKLGWQIGSHAPQIAEHSATTGVTLRQKHAKSRHDGLAIGVTGGEDFAWWGGLAVTADSLKACDQFFRSGRWNTTSPNLVETLPPTNPLLLQSWLEADGENLSGPKAYIDAAIAAGGMAIFTIHNIAQTATQTWLQGMLDYCDGLRGQLDVVTMEEALAPYLVQTNNGVSTLTVPSAPAQIATQDVNGGEMVAWTQPPSSGGAQVVAYAVQRRTYTSGTPGAWSTIATPRTSDMLQQGLMYSDLTATVGTQYDYRVVARNKVGDSPASPVANVTVAAPVRPSTPSTAVAPVGWWVPDDNAAANGAAITSVPDRSTSARAMSVTQTNAPTKLTNTLAGRGVAHHLAASSMGLKAAVGVRAEDITVVTVARVNTLAAGTIISGIGSNFTSTNDFSLQTKADGSVGPGPSRLSTFVLAQRRLQAGQWAVIGASLDTAANSHAATSDLNGEQRTATPTAYTANATQANVNVGSALQLTPLDMDWAELIVFPSKLSDADRKLWEIYAAKTWGVPVYPF